MDNILIDCIKSDKEALEWIKTIFNLFNIELQESQVKIGDYFVDYEKLKTVRE